MNAIFHARLNEDSYIPHGSISESSLTEGNGREGNGLEPPSQGVTTNLSSTTMGASELELRPYQAEAIQSLRTGLAGNYLRQMLYAPTGAGKTILAVGLVKGARLKGKRVAFLVNRVQLVEQTSAVFRRYGIEHGVIQGDNSRREYEHVLVCSIQTVARRGLPDDIDFIIIDEGHAVAGSKEYRDLMMRLTGKPVIALSATPFSKGLGKHYDELDGPLFERLVVASTIGELIQDGHLVDVDIYAPSAPDMTGYKPIRNAFGELDWSDKDAAEAGDKPELIGDIVSHWMRLAKNTPTVVFAANIAHSKHIVERFCAAGVKAEHLDCYQDGEERRAVLKRFESGETMIVSNASLLAEGWDAPFCKTLILARKTKSLIRYLQMLGRILRPFPGAERAMVLDHSGACEELGYPTDDLPLFLDDGKPRTSNGSDYEEKDVPLPKPCPKCKFMKPARVHKCPKCGFEPEKQSDIREAEGELKKLDRDKKKVKATAAEKQQFYSELLGMQAIKGYSDGRLSHLYREKFGVWPSGLQRVACEPSNELKQFIKSRNIAYAKRMEKQNAA